MKILFQGDSITDGFRKPEEINPAFQVGNGYVFLIAAHLGFHHPERNWEFINRGISGEGVRNLRKRWEEDALVLKPELFSLLIGVNDTIRAMWGKQEMDDDEFQENYEHLVDTVLQSQPAPGVILMEPFLLEAGTVVASWREHLLPRQKRIAEFARQRNLPLIPLQELFDQACTRAPAAYWAYDGIHPTHAGFALIARAWLQTAAPFLGIDFHPHSSGQEVGGEIL